MKMSKRAKQNEKIQRLCSVARSICAGYVRRKHPIANFEDFVGEAGVVVAKIVAEFPESSVAELVPIVRHRTRLRILDVLRSHYYGKRHRADGSAGWDDRRRLVRSWEWECYEELPRTRIAREIPDRLNGEAYTPEDNLFFDTLARQLEENLSDDDKAILRFVLKHTTLTADIAEGFGITICAAKGRLARLRRNVRKITEVRDV